MIRTIIAMAVSMAALTPALVNATGLDGSIPLISSIIAVAGVVTRVMAIPQVDDFLRRFAPWLSPD